MLRHATHDHRIGQHLDDAEAVDPPRYLEGQTLARELVDQRQQPQLAAIMRPGFDEVVGPDVIAPFRP